MIKNRVLFPPLRVGVPFFTTQSFRPKTDIVVTNRSLQQELRERLGDDTYKNAVFVRQHADYLIVLKGKVCGIYTPVLCLPPPLAHTAMVPEGMVVKGGLTVQQYIDCLSNLDEDYRSFLFFSMENGCFFYVMDRNGDVPKNCKFGPTFMKSRTHNEPIAKREVHDDEGQFNTRYTASSTSKAVTSSQPNNNAMMMQAGSSSEYFRSLFELLNTHYASEIDVCPTWWKRVAITSALENAKDITLFDKIARLSKIELKDMCPNFDFFDDKRWVICPSSDFDPRKVVNPQTDTINIDFVKKRMQRGFLKLDF